MNENEVYRRFKELQRYVNWEAADTDRIRTAGGLVRDSITQLINEFYAEIERHPQASRTITGGTAQVAKLKATLRAWLEELFEANIDSAYVMRRWRVGWRHVEIGLRQVYVNAAMARLRVGICRTLHEKWNLANDELHLTCVAVNRALDLDLAIIQDAYDAENKQRSESFFRSLIEAADCAIVILRDDYHIAYTNPYTQRLSGFTAPELEGENIVSRVFASAERDQLCRTLDHVKQNGIGDHLRIDITCSDATPRQLVWNGRRLRQFDGDPAILLVGHDITEISAAQDRALQAERLAAIGQTVTGLAHESRNAFQRMQACLEMLSLEVEAQPEALELVSRIQRAQDHLHQLYEEVRNYAAPIVLARQMCDMPHLVREIWEQLEISWQPKSLLLTVDRHTQRTNCSVDPFAFGQVIRNVLENAIAASPKGKTIEVSIEEASETTPVFVLTIRDRGPGMDAATLRQLFAPFFTTKARGTGLGMAIAKRLIDAHGGQIQAANHCEGGAIFRIELPYPSA